MMKIRCPHSVISAFILAFLGNVSVFGRGVSPCFDLLSPKVISAFRNSLPENVRLEPLSFFVKSGGPEEYWAAGEWICSCEEPGRESEGFVLPLVAKLVRRNTNATNEFSVSWFRIREWHFSILSTKQAIGKEPTIDIASWSMLSAPQPFSEFESSGEAGDKFVLQDCFLSEIHNPKSLSFDCFRSLFDETPSVPGDSIICSDSTNFPVALKKIESVFSGNVEELEKRLRIINDLCEDIPRTLAEPLPWNGIRTVPLLNDDEYFFRRFFEPIGQLVSISVNVDPRSCTAWGTYGYVDCLCNVDGVLCQLLLLPDIETPKPQSDNRNLTIDDTGSTCSVLGNGRFFVFPNISTVISIAD